MAEMQAVLINKGLVPQDATMLVKIYKKQVDEATQNHFTPAPTFRDLLKLAREILKTPTYTNNKNLMKSQGIARHEALLLIESEHARLSSIQPSSAENDKKMHALEMLKSILNKPDFEMIDSMQHWYKQYREDLSPSFSKSSLFFQQENLSPTEAIVIKIFERLNVTPEYSAPLNSANQSFKR